ncbi:amidohydrolase family protein [Dactylosporangium roseum]|uniref:Amidohydrolase family protein n=1 Tax=Dactylosporangium roseum TaxID=47989 RepID=A0ABY5Z1C1_9ACTN|nr:amidohydrolase family protein [Dactylosporangium roseum]UWZ34578.1 amidohydrolase family protein [Dactylosporangium roseum]
MTDLIIRDAVVITMAEAGVVRGDIAVTDGRIQHVGPVEDSAPIEIEAGGSIVMPGLVQAHTHLCQTIMRGLSDDVDVIQWLRSCVWPMEQAHTAESMAASCRLGIAELLLGGTTTVLSMESVHHTDASFEAAADLGIRAFIGKALMDREEPGTDMWGETTEDAVADILRLVDTWDGRENGRLRVALSPRCPRGTTPELWHLVVKIAEQRGLPLHTHVHENEQQSEMIGSLDEGRDIWALDSWGALNERMVMAHCVWPTEDEITRIAEAGAHICHCPSANLKLASGVAPVPTYLERGINVALGADGAACNNNLDGFQEMRLAALIHKPRHGADAMSAETVLELATMGGARALGMGDQIGSIEPGKLADLVLLRPSRAASAPTRPANPFSEIVYSRSAADVDTVLVGGAVVVRDGQLVTGDETEIVRNAEVELAGMLRRAGLSVP